MGETEEITQSPPEVPQISQQSMEHMPFALVIADMRKKDNPLVYVNPAFEEVTGYKASSVLGRNCRFLQGKNTEESSRNVIRDALEAAEEVSVDIINYRADGEEFNNRLLLTPLFDDDGNLTHFLGIQSHRAADAGMRQQYEQLEVSMRELRHRVKNHLAMLLSFVKLQANEVPDLEEKLEVLASRVRTLNLLYDDLEGGRERQTETVSLGAYISRICSALNMMDGRRRVVMNVAANPIDCNVDTAANIGLLMSEILTNAMQHGFSDNESGTVLVKLTDRTEGDQKVRLSVEDDGKGLPAGCKWPNEGNLGARIVRDLVKRLNADLTVESSSDGTAVTIDICL